MEEAGMATIPHVSAWGLAGGSILQGSGQAVWAKPLLFVYCEHCTGGHLNLKEIAYFAQGGLPESLQRTVSYASG